MQELLCSRVFWDMSWIDIKSLKLYQKIYMLQITQSGSVKPSGEISSGPWQSPISQHCLHKSPDTEIPALSHFVTSWVCVPMSPILGDKCLRAFALCSSHMYIVFDWPPTHFCEKFYGPLIGFHYPLCLTSKVDWTGFRSGFSLKIWLIWHITLFIWVTLNLSLSGFRKYFA
jgi:hypothetical protein